MSALHIGVALDGAGWHPAAWRDAAADPRGLFTGAYWAALARSAEAAGVDLLTLEDSFGLQTAYPFGRFDPSAVHEVRGRLDAVLLATWLAPATRWIGLIPTVSTTATEPFHVATAIATLDHTSLGRGGWRPVAASRPHEDALLGRRTFPELQAADIHSERGQAILLDRFGEAADAIEVVRRLWDSWQDDAVIRDVASGRYIDRDRLHYVDFEGAHFSVRGPSIVPRSPQGQPLVTLLAHQRIPYQLAARQGDVVFITPHDEADVTRIIDEVHDAERAVGRTGQPLQIWADVLVLLEDTEAEALAAFDRLDSLHGAPLASDALIVAGTAASLADRLLAWQRLGVEGVRLRPARLPKDLDRVNDGLLPLLRKADALGCPDAPTLRGRLGLPVAPNRYTDQPAFRADAVFVTVTEGNLAR